MKNPQPKWKGIRKQIKRHNYTNKYEAHPKRCVFLLLFRININ